MPDGYPAVIAEPIAATHAQIMLYQFTINLAGAGGSATPAHVFTEFGRGYPQPLSNPVNGGYPAPSKLLSFAIRTNAVIGHLLELQIEEATSFTGTKIATANYRLTAAWGRFNHRAFHDYVFFTLTNNSNAGQTIQGELKIFSEALK